jgi:hypothetical protein
MSVRRSSHVISAHTEPVDSVNSALKDSQEGIDDPVGEPLRTR